VASVSAQLPEAVRTTLSEFTAAAQQAFAEDLLSVVLFGSAAEGRLRATSDVNVVLALRHVDPKKLEAIGEAYRFAHAAIRLSAMFILETEISVAKDAFAVKFADIIARHEVLYGPDPFVGLSVSREAALHRLLQVLVNLQLRLRERYALSLPMTSNWRGRRPMPWGRCGPAPRYCCGSNRERGLRPATHCGRSRTRPAARPPSPLSARRARAVAYRQSGPRLRSSARSNSRRDLQSGQSKSSSPEI
jgi:predicted nucleotidyltransferase